MKKMIVYSSNFGLHVAICKTLDDYMCLMPNEYEGCRGVIFYNDDKTDEEAFDELKRNMSFSLKAREMDIKGISTQLGKLKLPKDN